MSGSRIITADDVLLDNVHPGDILREDFLIGSEIPLNDVALGSGVDSDTLAEIVASRHGVDAFTDARLARYLGVSAGFFLRLQNSYDMEEVVRHHRADLDRIVPRAA